MKISFRFILILFTLLILSGCFGGSKQALIDARDVDFWQDAEAFLQEEEVVTLLGHMQQVERSMKKSYGEKEVDYIFRIRAEKGNGEIVVNYKRKKSGWERADWKYTMGYPPAEKPRNAGARK